MNLPILVKPYVAKSKVIFHEYEETDEDLFEKYLADIFGNCILGLEQHDGSVIVYKDGFRQDEKMLSREDFVNEYFTEAI